MFWKKSKSHVTRVQLWRSVLSHVGDICLMYGILVLCLGYLSYVLEKIKIACYPGATMAECIVLCLGYLSYAWDISLMCGIFVLCMGYLCYVWDIFVMYGIFYCRFGLLYRIQSLC